MVGEMEGSSGLQQAIITQDSRHAASKLHRHGLRLEKEVDVTVMLTRGFKSNAGFAAHWTAGVVIVDPLSQTLRVNRMTTRHKHDRNSRGEHETMANGTIAAQVVLNAFVIVNGHAEAHVALHAVLKVNAQPFASTTD